MGHALYVGHPYRRSIVGTRRALLSRPRYHVYYVLLDNDG
jgi:hypothetical protein